ncbi:MAG TPA: SUMF1/EgtB/PvdO family nonheme iron enzyme [Planctomycetota bacterium]|nr:SUMF1/EgtB/PvdO family nonheme iron enzyme [Planctomycetota bacterium]
MQRQRSPRAAAFLALVAALACAMPSAAQERAAAPAADDRPAGESGQPAPRQPAGMVRFLATTKAKIGIDRKDLMKHIAETELGRVANIEKDIEAELSLCTPQWEAELPNFWISKYETTNAQYQRFLQEVGKTSYTVPPKGQVGDNTLEQISRRFLLSEKYPVQGNKYYFPVAVDWKGLYDLNMEALNPLVGPDGKPLDPALRPAADTFREKALAPGTRIVCYRYSVPADWKVKDRLQATVPPGRENQPVTNVSLVDAMACARHYGNHIPTEIEWEAACRGPGGAMFPEGAKFANLAHAWKGFNPYLENAQADMKAKGALKAAQARAEKARESGDAAAIARAEADLAETRRLLEMKVFPDESLSVDVGLFPAGRSPCGAMDMIGNVDEWVSSPLTPWPGTDSKSRHIGVVASILKGGNIIEKDTLLVAWFRRFFHGGPIRHTHKFSTGGFRMARYELPGASHATWAVREVLRMEPPVLPRGEDRVTKQIVGPTLEISGAVGIHRVIEVDWRADQPPEKDPPGKVFHTGRAEAICVVPASGTPYREPNALRNAASAHGPKEIPADGKPVKHSEPREVPFLGLLVLSEGVAIKAAGVQSVVMVKEPLPVAEVERLKKERQARIDAKKKEREEAEKAGDEEKKDGEGEKEGGDGEKKDGDGEKKDGAVVLQDGKGGKKGGGDGKKGGDDGKKGDKPADPADPAAPDPDAKGDDEEPEEDEEPPVPTHREVAKSVYAPGSISGKDHPNGLLLGLAKFAGEVRPCLWVPRLGTVGSMAPGGTVLLEGPYAYLEPDAISLKKVSRPGSPFSKLEDEVAGIIHIGTFLSIEGKGDAAKREAIEVLLKLKMTDSPPGNAPWIDTQSR